MSLNEAIRILRAHQVWRMGCDFAKPTDPKLLTQAIDVVTSVSAYFWPGFLLGTFNTLVLVAIWSLF